MKIPAALRLIGWLIAASQNPSQAQTGTLLDNSSGYTPVITEPTVRDSVGTFAGIGNTVFKPNGTGPFPAVVVVHTCGGLKNNHIRQHASELLEAGFAVLVQDSHGPRGFETCRQRLIPFAVGLMDAYAGLDHLSRLPFVDVNRIFIAGYSYGGFVAMLASSPRSAAVFKSPLRFRAAVASSVNCVRPSGAKALLDDVDRPLLLLLGGRDAETPMTTCFPLLDEMRDRGAPLKWHVYPEMTHSWDKQGESSNGYIYDREAATDATHRMIEFFNKNQ